jgi:glycine cleavage system H lipoate-binding protein
MVAVFVIATILAFLGVDYFVQRAERKGAVGRVPVPGPIRALSRLWAKTIPGGVLLHPGHAWGILQPGGSLLMGADQLVMGALGPVDRITTPAAGSAVRRGEPLLTLWRADRSLHVMSPADGRIGDVNAAVLERPGLALERLYEPGGWVVELVPEGLETEIGRFKVAKDALRYIQDEILRLKSFVVQGGLTPAGVPAAVADGGDLAEGFLGELESDAWTTFSRVFLKV